MTVFIPGFWDSIKNSATGFTHDLLRTVKPEVFGRYDMQQMMKQNPMMASQLAGMEEGQRDAFAQAFGLKNAAASPIGNIGTTPQLRQANRTERLQNDAETADPTGVLTQFGARTPEQQQVDATLPQRNDLAIQNAQLNIEQGKLGVEQGKQTIQLNAYRLKDAERASKQLEEQFTQYPTLKDIKINELAMDVVNNREVDSVLMGRIMNDEGARPLFEQYVKSIRDTVTEGFIRGRIKMTEDRHDISQMRMLINQGASDANQQMGRAMQEIKSFQANEGKFAFDLNGKLRSNVDPAIVERYKQLQEELNIAIQNNDTYGEARAKLAGVEFKGRERGSEKANDPAFQQELSAAQAAMSRATTDAQRQKIRDRFRQNTGQELP